MTIEGGTAVVLAYVLVSMGVIIAFWLAALVIDGSSVGRASVAANSAEKSNQLCWGAEHVSIVIAKGYSRRESKFFRLRALT